MGSNPIPSAIQRRPLGAGVVASTCPEGRSGSRRIEVRLVAVDEDAAHHSITRVAVSHAVVHGGPLVPQQQVAIAPGPAGGDIGPSTVAGQIVEHSTTSPTIHADHFRVRVGREEQSRAARLGVGSHNRMHGAGKGIDPHLTGLVTEVPGEIVEHRRTELVFEFDRLRHHPPARVELFVGQLHVGELRAASEGRRSEAVEAAERDRFRHKDQVGVPVIDPARGLHGLLDHLNIRLGNVHQSQEGMKVQRPKSGHERLVLLIVELLAGQNDNKVLDDRCSDGGDVIVAGVSGVDPGDHGTERSAERRYFDHAPDATSRLPPSKNTETGRRLLRQAGPAKAPHVLRSLHERHASATATESRSAGIRRPRWRRCLG